MKIEIKNLCKSYGTHVLFKDFSLTIESGQMIGIYGKSGCGKSTLLNMIGKLEPYNSGEILYDSQEFIDSQKFYRNEVSFLFQNFALMEDKTIYENLNLVLKVRKLKKDEKIKVMVKALNEVGLHLELKKPIYECSGGEQQRIAIAKILLKEPRLVLADEPTASLDQENGLMIMKLLESMKKRNITVIVVTHSTTYHDLFDQIISL